MAVPFFEKMRFRKPRYSSFDLSHDVKTTLRMGDIVPVLCQEVLPSDTWRINTEVFLRYMPMIAPVMHNVNVSIHNWYVPYRILWNDWDNFIRGGENNSTEYQLPILRFSANEFYSYVKKNSLADHFGVPPLNFVPTTSDYIDINALPFLAYASIYCNYYMDQNQEFNYFDAIKKVVDNDPIITSSTTFQNQEGLNLSVFDWLLTICNRCWEHDYFTSSMPNTQRGADVHLPIYGEASLINHGNLASQVLFPNTSSSTAGSMLGTVGTSKNLRGFDQTQDNPFDITAKRVSDGATGIQRVYLTDGDVQPTVAQINVAPHTSVDLNNALGATINDFRRALQLQKFEERLQASGNRPQEFYYGIFGVRVPDARLNIPEYLGGGRAPVIISEVLQQSQSSDDSALGTMGGRAVTASTFGSGKKYFVEYGLVISTISILPRSSYMQGLPKIFKKFDRFDYGIPFFAEIGEQAVKNSEVYFNPSDGLDNNTFGYVPRYSEYKFINNHISGEFRDSLSFWHLGRIFNGRPYLNRDFVHTSNDDLDRIFAVTQEDNQNIVCQLLHHIRAKRPLPYYSNR